MRLDRATMLTIAMAAVAALAGCKSRHVEMTVENHAGEAVQLLEVDYPSASFGKNTLAAGTDYHYRIQVNGSGKLKVLYTGAGGHAVTIDGPELNEGDEGRVEIILQPQGAEFHVEVTPHR